MKFLNLICQNVSIRNKRRIIAFSYHALIAGISVASILAGQALSSPCFIKASITLLIADILTFRVIPVTLWIEEKLIPEAVCYGCGAAIDLVGLYKCGCGFLSHKERHLFSPCPMCGKSFSWITCPECETSIPI